jgi:hypothetical protein
MNRTKEAGRARAFIVFSFLVFVCAAGSTLIPGYGSFLALGFVLIGGFLMMIGAIIRDRSKGPEIGKRSMDSGILEDQRT